VPEHPNASTPDADSSPYVEFDRAGWARLREHTPLTLTSGDVDRLRGLGEPLDIEEVADVYLPVSRLLNLYVAGTAALRAATSTFLGERPASTPFVVAIAGSVAVGKSTTARILRELLAGWPEHPRVELVTTDGFLLPNAELARRELMDRKGFPESYDQRRLLRFVVDLKSGVEVVRAPVYSHLSYDVVPDAHIELRRPDILLLEGLNVLQPPGSPITGRRATALSDFFDFSLYVDADVADISRWYVERFLRLRDTAFRDPASYFQRYAELSDDAAVAEARRIWATVNEVNLVRNILPTRERARLVLSKGPDHAVRRVRLRKV
jgi:type I pantothenate kinase